MAKKQLKPTEELQTTAPVASPDAPQKPDEVYKAKDAEPTETPVVDAAYINDLIATNKETVKTNEVFDGFHTFAQLYDHRTENFIALCRVLAGRFSTNPNNPAVWRSRLHSDGTGFEGWFVLGINKREGEQITYHLPESRWKDTGFAETLETAPPWDNHTADDVLQRLKNIF